MMFALNPVLFDLLRFKKKQNKTYFFLFLPLGILKYLLFIITLIIDSGEFENDFLKKQQSKTTC